MSESILRANLDSLRARHPDLVDRLMTTSPAEDMVLHVAGDGLLTGAYGGISLASRHRPLEEAQRFVSTADIRSHAVVAVLGFGLGHHVAAIARKMKKTGLVLVYEPDVRLLRRVFEEIDHSAWVNGSHTVFFTDPDDRPALARRLEGAAAILVQGIQLLPHAPSRPRLGDSPRVFADTLTQHVGATRTTMMTTLVQSPTSCRNVCLNLDQYVSGRSINSLRNWAAGRPAILVAAGPSLSRNVALLMNESVRAKAVIIAVQTALKPLLRMGVRPHFVTALDYHEISRQFYDGLRAEELTGTVLVIDPKVNRSVVDAYPGRILHTGNAFAEKLLGPLAPRTDLLPAAASVGHMNFYLAQYLGCDPVILVGQDLGFTDGLYYGDRAAIHEQWSPEINLFNTIEMMEWQRVARMKRTIRPTVDIRGRVMLTDEQMATYLQQFEREFAQAPQRIIDATEGGAQKRGTRVETLSRCISEYVGPACPLPPVPPADGSDFRVQALRRIEAVISAVRRLAELSRSTQELLTGILALPFDAPERGRLFDQIDHARQEVGTMLDIVELVNSVNQLGLFNRLKADRAIELADDIHPHERQRLQLERDQINVRWLAAAADELAHMLEESLAIMHGGSVDGRISRHLNAARQDLFGEAAPSGDQARSTRRVVACLWADPDQSPIGQPRSLSDDFAGRSVLAATLSRLDRVQDIEAIILCLPEGASDRVRQLIRGHSFAHALILHEAPPMPRIQRDAIRLARRWSPTSWRGGIGGMSIFDEVTHPQAMLSALTRVGCDAALIVGADWPLLDPSTESGCALLVRRFKELPPTHRITFTQAPPGLCGFVATHSLLDELALGVRKATIGSLLTYMPQLPQLDPTSKEVCVKLDASIRNCHGRFVWDSRDGRDHISAVIQGLTAQGIERLTSLDVAARFANSPPAPDWPREVELELTGDRMVRWSGAHAPDRGSSLAIDQWAALIGELARNSPVALTLGGSGDPLCHPGWREIVQISRSAGVSAIHLRTDLACCAETLQSLINADLDVISVNLNADSQAVYPLLASGCEWSRVISNLETMLRSRDQARGVHRLGLPWIIPTLHKFPANVEQIRSFYDRWWHHAGAAALRPSSDLGIVADDVLQVAVPAGAADGLSRRTLLIRCDGVAPVSWTNWFASDTPTVHVDEDLKEAWEQVLARRGLRDSCIHRNSYRNLRTPVTAIAV